MSPTPGSTFVDETVEVHPVHLDETSSAASLREDTRKRAYQSLAYFLTSVLNVPVPTGICEELQRLGLRRLGMLAVGTLLWCRIHKTTPKDPADHDAVRWLFPEVRS